MKAVFCVLAALALSQVVVGQTQSYSSTLFQTYNVTSAQTGFYQCNESSPIVGVAPAATANDGTAMTPLSATAAGQVTIDAIWFGGEIGPALNFQVVGNCSALQLTSNGGHGTTFYTGPVPLAPNGCTTAWYQSANYLHLFVTITNTGFAWSVSLPTVTTVRAQTSCNGGYQYCPLATASSCQQLLNSPTTLNADGSKPPSLAPPADSTPTLPGSTPVTAPSGSAVVPTTITSVANVASTPPPSKPAAGAPTTSTSSPTPAKPASVATLG